MRFVITKREPKPAPADSSHVVAHRGFEPLISALRGRCPRPLDECAVSLSVSQHPPFIQGIAPSPSPRRRAPLLLVLLALFAAWPFISACTGGSSRSVGTTTATAADAPLPALTALPPDLEQVLDRIAELRGLPIPQGLHAGFIARSQLPALLRHLTTDDDRRVFANTTTLYRLLGHLRKDQDFESVYNEFTGQAVIGLYSPQDKALWIVHGDNEPLELSHLPKETLSTLAHELTHALQDSSFDLLAHSRDVEDDIDRSLAYSAVVEGDAVITERAYAGRYLALLSNQSIMAAFQGPLADVPASLAREFYFPYQDGTAFVEAVKSKGGQQAIDALLAAPPSGTAIILHPELITAGFQPAKVTLPDLATALGSGWTRESGGALGEFGLRNYLQLRLPGLDASRVAAGWAGDHYDVYAKGSNSLAVFRIHFATQDDATEFAAQHAKFLAAQQSDHRTVDETLELTATNDGNTTIRLAQAGPDIVFVIASNEDTALRAARSLHGG